MDYNNEQILFNIYHDFISFNKNSKIWNNFIGLNLYVPKDYMLLDFT